VEFINYEGPHLRIETWAQIRSIGYDLGLAVRTGNFHTGALHRYFVIHSVSAPDGNRLDADIFGIGVDAAVNHIRNLRLIIQGYLEGAYNYSQSDAALLAEYITIYNAVFRGDWNFFNLRYKDPVISHLVRERAGLSLRYDDWPGQTLMLIPLGLGIGGQLSAVDIGAINNDRVVEHLRQDPDMGIAQRQDMVDLMEREADAAAQQAAIIRDAIQQEEERIAAEQQALQQQEQQIAEAMEQPGADQQALNQQQQVVQQQQQELAQQEQALAQQAQQAEMHEALAEQRIEHAQQDRQQIAEDMQLLMDMEPPPPVVLEGSILGVSVLAQASSLGRIVRLDPSTGREIRRSPLTSVNVRTINLVNNRLLAIAGENRGNAAIRIVEIDEYTLEMVRHGDDDIAPGSLLWLNGQDLFAVVSTGGNHYMARFNANMVLQNRSTMTVHPFASALFYGDSILTQRADGSAVMLNSLDMTERR
jgi:flagellar motor protein MotB